jgi:transposase
MKTFTDLPQMIKIRLCSQYKQVQGVQRKHVAEMLCVSERTVQTWANANKDDHQFIVVTDNERHLIDLINRGMIIGDWKLKPTMEIMQASINDLVVATKVL